MLITPFILGGAGVTILLSVVSIILATILAVWVALLPTIQTPIRAPHWEYADQPGG